MRNFAAVRYCSFIKIISRPEVGDDKDVVLSSIIICPIQTAASTQESTKGYNRIPEMGIRRIIPADILYVAHFLLAL
jgi:hypothetical protein